MRAYLQRLIALIKGALAYLKLFKFPNATIFGQPTIQDGQVSNFSTSNYLQFPFLVDFAGRPWQIDCAFTTGADVSQQHNIFDSAFGLAFAFANGHFVMALSTNGTSWNLGAPEGTHAIVPLTTYYVRIAWDGSRYTLAFSTDKENYTTDISVTSDASLYPRQIIIGKDLANLHVFNGSINMNHAMLTISGKVVWQGMDDAGLATRMAIDMSNIDAAGKLRLNNVAMEGEVGQKLGDLSSQMDDKFSIGGYDESARVGFANNLIGVPYREENAEFFYRKTGGLAEVVDGSATIKSIKGSSVVWNQCFGKGLSTNGEVWDERNIGQCVVSGVFETAKTTFDTNGVFKVPNAGNKVMIVFSVKGEFSGNIRMRARYVTGADVTFSQQGEAVRFGVQQSGTYIMHREYQAGSTLNNVTLSTQYYDLTQMFGAGNEPTTYEEFLFRKPQVADEYAYNEGEIVSANIAKYKSHNADGTKEFVRELPDDSVFFDDVLPSGEVVKGMKGAGNAFDERTEKQRIKRFGVVDLGSFRWSKTYSEGSYGWFQATEVLPQCKGNTLNLKTSIYAKPSNFDGATSLSEVKIGVSNAGSIRISLGSTYAGMNVEQFRTAMQGVYLVYELAEPIVEDVEAANLSVNVWHNGTEEAIAKDGTPSTPLKATIDYDLDYPAQVKSLMQLHTETAALLQQLQS